MLMESACRRGSSLSTTTLCNPHGHQAQGAAAKWRNHPKLSPACPSAVGGHMAEQAFTWHNSKTEGILPNSTHHCKIPSLVGFFPGMSAAPSNAFMEVAEGCYEKANMGKHLQCIFLCNLKIQPNVFTQGLTNTVAKSPIVIRNMILALPAFFGRSNNN